MSRSEESQILDKITNQKTSFTNWKGALKNELKKNLIKHKIYIL